MSAINLEIEKANPLRTLLKRLAPAPLPEPPVLQPVEVAPAPKRPSIGRILVVDDDAFVLKTTARKLEAEGYSVIQATDGAAAIQAVRRDKPDLILLDLTLPSDVGAVLSDGLATMTWLRRMDEARGIPIFVVTAGDPVKYRQRCLSAGAMAFFSKPLAYECLISLIGRTLGLGSESGGCQRRLGDFQI